MNNILSVEHNHLHLLDDNVTKGNIIGAFNQFENALT